MFGHKWEHAEGTIVEYRPDEVALAGAADQNHVHVYVVEVRKPTGQVVRASVRGSAGMQLAVGTVVRVEVNPKTGEVRFDPSARKLNVSSMHDAMKLAEQVRAQMATGGTAAAAAALSGLPAGMQPGQAPGSGHPSGVPGMQVVTGDQATELMQELLSGKATDRGAAIARLKQLKSDVAAQAAGQARNPADPFSPPAMPTTPGTFDEPNSFSPPPTPSTFSQASSFTPPATPSTFDQASSFTPPPTPSTFDPASRFSTASSFGQADQASAADRITKLQDLRDKGLITRPEFEAQRQRILDDI